MPRIKKMKLKIPFGKRKYLFGNHTHATQKNSNQK